MSEVHLMWGESQVAVDRGLLAMCERTEIKAKAAGKVRWCPWDRQGVCTYKMCSYAHAAEGKKEELMKVMGCAGEGATDLLAGYRVVLVDPQDSRNVGSVARLCANYGIDDVWVVSRRQLDWEEKRNKRCKLSTDEKHPAVPTNEVCPLLNTAFWRYSEMLATPEGLPLLKSFNVVPELSEALVGVDRAIAFTGKRGSAFRVPTLDVPAIPEAAAGRRLALVFGNEAHGLSSNDTLLCSGICTLPTTSYCTSLNLSHSAIVVVSRLWEMKHGTAPSTQGIDLPEQPPATDAEVGDLFEACRATLETKGYPCSKTDWGGAERRRNKFAYRCHKHVTSLVHLAQRAKATPEELQSIKQLVNLLVTDPPASGALAEEEAAGAEETEATMEE